MIDFLDSLDKQLMLLLNHDGGALQDELWWYVSASTTWIPLYVLLLALLCYQCRPLRTGWKHLVLLVVTTVLVAVLSDQVSAGIIKPIVMRPRPTQPDSGIAYMIHCVHGYRGGHYGFVSSHATNVWSLTLWFILLWRKSAGFRPLKRGTGIVLALLVVYTLSNCYSRIYLGVHYPGDILGGLVTGTLIALFCYYVIYLNVKKRLIAPSAEKNIEKSCGKPWLHGN